MSLAERALDSAPVVLDDTALRDIRARLGVAGVADGATFVLMELSDRGLLASVIDAGTGARLAERADDGLSPRMLDLAVADHLVRTGRVERPESDEWADELRHLVTGLRATLATSDGAFAMGTAHVGLVRVSRRDLVVALHPHLMAAAALWQSVTNDCERPVGGIVLRPDHRQWPGLVATLAQHAPIPAVAVGDEGVATGRVRGRHGTPAAAPEPDVTVSAEITAQNVGSEQSPTTAPVVLAPPVPLEPTPVFASMSRPVEPPPDPPAPTPAPEPVATPAPVPAPPVAPTAVAPAAFVPVPVVPQPVVPQPVVPQPVVPQTAVPQTPMPFAPVSHMPVFETAMSPGFSGPEGPHLPPPFAPAPRRVHDTAAPIVPGDSWNPSFRATGEHDAFFGPGGEREPISVHDHRDVRDPGGPRHYSPPALVTDTASPEARRVHNRRLFIGAGAVASSAALGVIVLTLPWIDQGPPTMGVQVNAAQTAQPPGGPTSTPSPTQPSRPPLDLGAARSPATQYTAPPPTQPPTAQAAPRRSNPAPRARPRPRSIPNPIPGLPPILLP